MQPVHEYGDEEGEKRRRTRRRRRDRSGKGEVRVEQKFFVRLKFLDGRSHS